MKKLTLLLLCLVAAWYRTAAQNPIELGIELFEPYPVNLEYYLTNRDNAIITVQNTTPTDREIFFHLRITSDNGLLAQTRGDYRPGLPISVPAGGVLVITGDELNNTDLGVNSLSDLDISGITQAQRDFIEFHRALPEGNYQICLQAFDWLTNAPLGFNCSMEFGVWYGDLPVITYPMEGDVLFANPTSSFIITWEPPFTTLPTAGSFLYRLKMVDITHEPIGSLEDIMNNPATFPLLDAQNIGDLLYQYDYPPEWELEDGHRYAIRLQAEDPTGATPVTNNGYSEIVTFWYGHNPDDLDGAADDAEAATANCDADGNCDAFPLGNNQTAVASVADMEALQVGYFTIRDLNFSNTNGGSAAGTGTVMVPFLDSIKINVTFDNVQVNAQGRITGGQVIADRDYTYDPATASTGAVSNLDRFLRSEKLISTLLGGRNRALSMPIGMVWNIGGDHLMLGFNDMTFTPTRASCQVLYNMHYPQWGDYWLSMSASDICMTPAGFGEEFYLHPAVDIPLPNIGDTEYYISGTTSNDPAEIQADATFVQVDCKGIANVGMNMEVRFSRAVLVPDTDDGEPGDGRVSGWITATTPRTEESPAMGSGEPMEWGVLGQYSMDRFQIRSLPGLGFTLDEGWADFSDSRNAPGMNLPPNYEDANVTTTNGVRTLDALWEGFYMKSLSVRSAEGWLYEGERLEFSASDVIIDDLITAKIQVSNIVSAGEINNWFVSLDTLYLELVQWSANNTGTWNAGLGGRLGMPITGEDEFFAYSALLLPQDSGRMPNMEFLVRPSAGGLSFPFMQSASATICPNSYIRVVQENGGTYFDAQLAGNMGVTFTTPVTFTIPWVDFQFGYHSEDGFSNQAFSILGQQVTGGGASCDNIPPPPPLASGEGGSGTTGGGTSGSSGTTTSGGGTPLPPPPGATSTPVAVNNFPMSIDGLGIEQINLDNIRFNINPRIELGGGGESGFGADADLAVRSETNPATKKLALDGIDLGALSINMEDVFGMNIAGSIEFYQEDNDKGARGELSIDLPLGISTDLKADFGVRAINTNRPFGDTDQYFGYWYVDGMVGFPGVPLAPGVNLHGLGGGVYINMERNDGFGNQDMAAVQAVVDDLMAQIPDNLDAAVASTPDALRPTPKFGTYGLKLAVRLATPVESALNMDVSIAGSFARGIGINSLSVDGDAYLMSSIEQRDQGSNFWAAAGFGWEYNGGSHKFSGNIDLFANVAGGMIKGKMAGNKIVGVAFDADTGTGKWSFFAGEPNDRAGLIADFGIVRQSVDGYFMLGHGLPRELPIPQRVNDLIGASSGSGSNKLNNPNPVTGTRSREQGDAYYGQAQGVAFGLETSVEFEMRAWALYASLEAFLGFDINITQLDGATCYIPGVGEIAPGVNDWYATGQIYAGFEGAMGLKGKFLGKEREFELFQMAAAMIISGGGPNPMWAEGRAGASYRVLNGLIKGSVNFDVRVGDRCEPAPEASDLIPVVYELSPGDGENDVSVFASDEMLATFLLPIDERIEVPIIWEPTPGVRQTILADIEIYIDEFSLKNNATNTVLNGTKTYSQDRQAVTLNTGSKFSSRTDYTLTLRVKATDYTFVSAGVPFKEGNADWKEERIHAFTTGATPYPIPDDEVVKTLPIRNQRYFLQDEINALYRLESPTILFTMDMGDDEYFPDNDDKNDYDYYFRWASYDGNEPIIVDANELRGKSPVQLVMTDLPRLENDTYYSCQLVRKTTKVRSITGADGQAIRIPVGGNELNILENRISVSDGSFAALGMSRADTLSIDITIDPGQYKAYNEDVIYQFDFKTSQYNTLAAKMAGASFNVTEINNSLSKYPKLTFEMDENFDVFDIEGEYNEVYGGYVSLPRVEFSTRLGAAQPTYYTDPVGWINPNGYADQSWEQAPYSHLANQGMAGYTNYLNQSAVGFVQLYDELAATAHTFKLSHGSETRTVTSTPPSLGTALAVNGDILRGNYSENNLTFYLRDRRAAGYDGPLNANELSQAWDAHLATQSFAGLLQNQPGQPSTNGFASVGSALGSNASAFTLEYYVPVWTAEDVMALSDAGAYLLSRTYIWDANIGGSVGGTTTAGGTETTLGGSSSVLNNGIAQTIDSNGSTGSGGDIVIVGGHGAGGGSGTYTPPTYVNYYSNYVTNRYTALLVQLDNMNHAAKYYQLQNHKGDFEISLQADRGFLTDMMLPGPKTTLPFNYGTYTAQGTFEMTTGSSAGGGSFLEESPVVQQQQNYGGVRIQFR